MQETQLDRAFSAGRLDVREARHGAAHALAHIYFGQRFISVGPNAEGICEIVKPVWGVDPATNARIALAGPCTDLAVDLVEDGDDRDATILNSLTTWREDVFSTEHVYFDDLMTAGGWMIDAAPWSLAFINVNQELIDEGAKMLIDSGRQVSYASFSAQFQGRAADVDTGSVEDAHLIFAGSLQSLELVEEAVAQIVNGF